MPKVVPKICIVDYGRGNLRSVINSLEYVTDCNVCVSNKKKEFYCQTQSLGIL